VNRKLAESKFLSSISAQPSKRGVVRKNPESSTPIIDPFFDLKKKQKNWIGKNLIVGA